MFSSIPTLLRTSLFLTLSSRDTPTKLLKHFISRTLPPSFTQHFWFPTTLLRAAPLVQLLIHIDASKSSIVSTPSALTTLYSSFIMCFPSLAQPPSAATCDPRNLMHSSSWVRKLISHSFQQTFTYLEHLITLLLLTFTLNFTLSYTLSNSLTSLHNFSSESATGAVSSGNTAGFFQTCHHFPAWVPVFSQAH